jgi:hypothetical protein
VRDGYCSELWFTADPRRGARHSLEVSAIPQRDLSLVTLRGRSASRRCGEAQLTKR